MFSMIIQLHDAKLVAILLVTCITGIAPEQNTVVNGTHQTLTTFGLRRTLCGWSIPLKWIPLDAWRPWLCAESSYRQNIGISSHPTPCWCCGCCRWRTCCCLTCLRTWLWHTWCSCLAPSCQRSLTLPEYTHCQSHAAKRRRGAN